MLWDSPSELLRSQGQAHSGPVLWGAAPLPWAEKVRRVRCQPCGTVKPEQVPWLASIPFDMIRSRLLGTWDDAAAKPTSQGRGKTTQAGLEDGEGLGVR